VIIVDASIALAWCLGDEADDYAERMLDRVARETAVAPAHWPIEVANGLRSAERRGRLSTDELPRVGKLLNDLGVEIVPVELNTAFWALDTARTHDLSAYDAVYLDLALSRGLPLATLDGPLAAACRKAGVELAS
jgi:predicted nucleic acid-binding protein